MSASDAKKELHRYLQSGRDVLLWKLDGLSEYDIRRPLTPTGTNLLGLVKHLATVELGYFGDVFGRSFSGQLPAWYKRIDEPNVDMWAALDESRDYLIGLYRTACAHADTTIMELPLEATGRVPWWPAADSKVTLHKVMAHVIAETHRHAGHADIVRELIDGSTGWQRGNDILPSQDEAWWKEYTWRLQQIAEQARQRSSET